jgi:hypothetical protein
VVADHEARDPRRDVARRLGPEDLGDGGQPLETGAGWSSTMLKHPATSLSMAATVAEATSSTCTNDQTPAPEPTIGKRRLRIA